MATLRPGQIVNALAPLVGRVGAAGIAGNLMQESSDDPARQGGGLAQWQGSRYAGLVNYARSRNLPTTSPQAALGYLIQDLKGPYSGLTHQLRAANNPGHAATLFSQIYERPGTPMLGNRVRYAQQALGQKGAAGLPGLPAIPGAPGASGAQSVPVTTQHFDQAAFDKAQQAAVAGQFLAQSANGVSMWQTGPKSTVPAGASLFGPGLLTTTEPSRADFTTTSTSHKRAQTVLQKLAGGTTLSTHPNAAGGSYPAGVSAFGGKPVAKWIVPILRYAKQHGWQGSVNSGYRSFAQQSAIYNSGIRPAAVPGTSNHEGDAFPRGAIDVSDAQQLSRILRNSPYASTLVWAGSKDPVHFSHPHGGSY